MSFEQRGFVRVVGVDCGQLTDDESYRFVPVASLDSCKLTVIDTGVVGLQ